MEIQGHLPIFAWMLRRSSFIHNRFFVTSKGLAPYEVIHGRRYSGKLLVFGEQCIFYTGSRFKGDLQRRKGIWAAVNERNNARVILTNTGAHESRSVRRLPAESQWSAEAVTAAKGFPWAYGETKRRRPIYSAVRVPLLPDSASLEEIAKAAGRAGVEFIAAATPVNIPGVRGGGAAGPRDGPGQDEAGSDSSSSSSTSSSPSGNHGGAPSGVAPAVPLPSGVAPAVPLPSGVAARGEDDARWDFNGEKPPDLSPDELRQIDHESDKKELERLVAMGVLRAPKDDEDVTQYPQLNEDSQRLEKAANVAPKEPSRGPRISHAGSMDTGVVRSSINARCHPRGDLRSARRRPGTCYARCA